MGKKNPTPESALRNVARLAARKAPKNRIYRAMRRYYKAVGRPVPDDLSSLVNPDGVMTNDMAG